MRHEPAARPPAREVSAGSHETPRGGVKRAESTIGVASAQAANDSSDASAAAVPIVWRLTKAVNVPVPLW
jgi:hypothetical protein